MLLAYLDVFADQAQMDSPQCWCFFLGGEREGGGGVIFLKEKRKESERKVAQHL